MIVTESYVDLKTPSGSMRTYVYKPASPGKYPGLVFFSEIFHQTGPIKRTAKILAGHGFIVVVPEIFHEFEEAGTVIPYDQEGADRGNRYKVSKAIQSYDDDAVAALDFLTSSADCTGKLGVIGVCIGGHLSFRAGMNSHVLASVCFYATDIHKRSLGLGMNDNSLDRIGEIKGELMMIWGRQDPHVSDEGRAIIYQALTKAGTNFTWHEFNAQHAFLRDEGPRYDPELAFITLNMAISLFKRRLGEGDLNS